MSRPLRIEYPNAWYHLMNRGRRYENIFETTQDYHLFIRVLREASEMFGLRVSAFCLMPNHYHLLVQTPLANLSRCMRHINGVYTQRYNREHEIDGSLFRGRYKAVCIEDDFHLLEVMRYIHNNPIKAGLVKNFEDYRWLSHHGYFSKAKEWNWLHRQILLDMLAKRKSKQRASYLEFVQQGNSEEIEKFYSRKKWLPVLGSEKFKEKIRFLIRKKGDTQDVITSYANELCISSDRILRVVCEYYKIDKEMLLYSRRGFSNLPRDIALYVMQKHRQDTLREIGQVFGIEKYSSVSSGIVRAQKAINENERTARDADAIMQLLIKSQK